MKPIRQHDQSDCGAACLAMIASHYGKHLSVAHVRLLIGTDSSGSSLAALHHAALRLGFQCAAVSGNYDALQQCILPVVVHLNHHDTGEHFIILEQIGAKQVKIIDPADGQRHRWPKARFCTYWGGAALLLLPGGDFIPAKTPRRNWQRLWPYLYPHRGLLAKALFLAMAATLLAIGSALFVQLLTDIVVPRQNRSLLWQLSALFGTLLLVQVAISYIKQLFTLKSGRTLDARLLNSYCRHLLDLPHAFFQHMQSGELLSRMGDVMKIRYLVNDLLIQLGVPLIVVLFTLMLLVGGHPQLGYLLLISIPLHVGIYLLGHRLHQHIQRRVMEADAALDQQFTESFQAIATIKQLGLSVLHATKLEARIHQFLQANYASGSSTLFIEQATTLLVQAFSLAILGLGGAAVLQGQVSLGELLAFYTLSGYFSSALAQLMPLTKHVQEARIAADRLFSILELPAAQPTAATLLRPSTLFPVHLQQVCFHYRQESPVLRQVSLSIQAGELVVIRGSSGIGKSTLLSIISGQFVPHDGQVYLNGHPIHLIHPDSLQQWVAVVPQHIELFNDTLAANIYLDRPADANHLAAILRELGMLSWAESLAEGFDTPIGPNGCRLSGGQRQRLALARALYREPQLLLLDEATAALDAESEQLIHRALLARKQRGMAQVWISHSTRSVALADQIWQLQAGQLVLETNRTPYDNANQPLPAER